MELETAASEWGNSFSKSSTWVCCAWLSNYHIRRGQHGGVTERPVLTQHRCQCPNLCYIYFLVHFCCIVPCTDTLKWARIETHCAPSPRLDVAMCPIRIPGNISEDHKDQSVNAIFVFGGVDTGGNAYDDCYVLKL